MNCLDRIFVALDQMTDQEAYSFLECQNQLTHYKIGLELYLRYGRPFIEYLTKKYPFKIFLDLKLHDIPQTVGRSIRSLEGLNIHFLTLHLSGGKEMAKQAIRARNEYCPQVKLLGVGYLTSLKESELPEIFGPGKYCPASLAQKAELWGLDGLICSPWELDALKEVKVLKVCPGIRFFGDPLDDQSRVADPKEAFDKGADYIVMGRSLTRTNDLFQRIEKLASL